MIEQYDLSFLNLNTIRNSLLRIKKRTHGLITNGYSTYNYGMPVLEYSDLQGLNKIIQSYIDSYCKKYHIPDLKIINSWFNISKSGNQLKPHKHEESIVSGAFYISGKTPLIFPSTKINPKSGLLVIFSSDLVHYTEEETEERIVISFNTNYL